MSDTNPDQAGQPHSEPTLSDVRHERTDANARGIVIFGLSLAGVLIVLHLVLHWMFNILEHREQRDDPGRPAVAAKRPIFPKNLDDIPSPVLQRDAEYDLERLRRNEDYRLSQEGWVDKKSKTVRVPIADAIRRLEANPRAAGIRFRAEPKQKQNGGKQ